jgi:hypothetical protein
MQDNIAVWIKLKITIRNVGKLKYFGTIITNKTMARKLRED